MQRITYIIIIMLWSISIPGQTILTDTCYIVGDMAERRVREIHINSWTRDMVRVHAGGDRFLFPRDKKKRVRVTHWNGKTILRWRAIDQHTGLKLTVYYELCHSITFSYRRGLGPDCKYKIKCSD